MDYTIGFSVSTQHWLEVEVKVATEGRTQLELQLPAWRPGRYELSHFARNVRHWSASDEHGEALSFQKLSKDCWQVECGTCTEVYVRYQYYANTLDAGSSYLDEHQLYVNPVNCLLFQPGKDTGSHRLKLDVPEDYLVSTSLPEIAPFHFEASDFQELADSPIIASPTLRKISYEVKGISFHLWFQGDWLDLDHQKLETDFRAFIEVQLDLFGSFPVAEYHFQFQFVPFKAYHGVEHLKSTVIVLGPNYKLSGEYYPELLGVSSHELFHTWNIKAIRPAEMWPYDFTKENYSRLGYVAEGVTTYYGDQLLLRAGCFELKDFLTQLVRSAQRHIENPAKDHYSVAESSFDTWLDGYSAGIPGRKLSIYADGCVLAFITDVLLLQHSNNQRSLDDVMRLLYHEFGKEGKGYTEADYFGLIERVGNSAIAAQIAHFASDGVSMENALLEAFDYLGWNLETKPANKISESQLGLKLNEAGKITGIFPGSPADEAGLAEQDQVVALNGIAIEGDFDKWAAYRLTEEYYLDVKRKMGISRVRLMADGETWYQQFQIKTAETNSGNTIAWCRKKTL